MVTGFDALAQAGVQNAERQSQLEDEKRKSLLKTLLPQATTAKDQVDVHDAVYHNDPGVLRQYVENLARRATGKPTQPVVSPQQAQQTRIDALAPRLKSLDQQALEFNAAQGKAQNQSKLDYEKQAAQQQSESGSQQAQQKITDFQVAYKKATGQDPTPEIMQAFTVSAYGGDRVLSSITQAESLKAREEYQQAQTALRQASLDFQKAKAEAASDPNNLAARTKAAQAQAAMIRAKAYAEGIEGRYQGTINGKPMAGGIIDADGNVVPPVNSTNVRPTGTQRERATLAGSAMEQLDDMSNILSNRTDLFGPTSGRVTNFRQWLGTQDPDAQKFRAAARVAADHLAGVFGGRSDAALSAIYSVIGNNLTNPQAAIAGIQQIGKAAKSIKAVGEYSTVGGGGVSPTGNRGSGASPAPKQQGQQKAIVQHSASTGKYRYSTDGGKTWQPGQPQK